MSEMNKADVYAIDYYKELVTRTLDKIKEEKVFHAAFELGKLYSILDQHQAELEDRLIDKVKND